MSTGILVSIGIPVYNGAETIARAIDSILRQTYHNIEIVISDNCSTDNTEQICNHYTKINPKIIFFKQSKNKGVANNFQFVLEKSNGKFFMWAAADDEWGEEFVELALAELLKDETVVGVTIAPFDYPCTKSVGYGYFGIENTLAEDRIKGFLKILPDGNARFYCLYRTSALRNIDFSIMEYLAWDWLAIIKILMAGKIRVLYNKSHGFVKHENGESTRRWYLLSYCHSILDVFRPLRHIINGIPLAMRKNSKIDIVRIEISYALRIIKVGAVYLTFKICRKK
jgi:glycosyltransferase involved in cell wall biosynthesis